MNTPNPFIPQGSLLEQNKRRSRMKLAVFCVLAVSVCGLTAMLIQGCKREQNAENPPSSENNLNSMIETSATPVVTEETSAPPAVTSAPPVVPAPPPATPVAPVMPQTAGTEYVVVSGDTLGKIARNNHVSLKALEAANPGVVPTRLRVGQKLTIPPGGVAAAAETLANATGVTGEVYVVKSGDNLSKIARTHGTTVKALQAENHLATTMIRVGQKLRIPAKAEAAAPVAAPMPVETSAPAAPPVEPAATSAPAGMPNGQ
jgi:LysM repeat protein